MSLHPILALDVGTIVQAIIFLVALIAWVTRALSEAQEAQKARQAKREILRGPADELDPFAEPVPRQMEAGLDAPAAAPPQPADKVRSEVEEFLRRVATTDEPPRPSDKAAPKPARGDVAQPPRKPRIEVINPPPQPPPKPRRLAETSFDTVAASPAPSVAQHVAEHLAAGRVTAHAAALGYELTQVDERTEARLKSQFDHRVGSLSNEQAAAVQAAAKAASESPAARIVDLLRTPQGMQQAVILNEILSRPVDRW